MTPLAFRARVCYNCIRFLCDFHSPVTGETAWEPDTEYTGWSWFLGRVEGGGWELVDWGY